MFSWLKLYAVALLAGALFAVPMSSQAQALVSPSVSYSGSAGRLAMGSLNQVGSAFRTWAANPAAIGEVLIKDSVIARVGAANASMYAVKAVPWLGVLTLAAKALPFVGAAAMAYSIYDALRCHKSDNGSAGLSCDPGKPSSMQKAYCFYPSTGRICSPSPMGASMLIAAIAYNGYQTSPGPDTTCVQAGTGIKGCYVRYWVDMPDPKDTVYHWAKFEPAEEQALNCDDNKVGTTYTPSQLGPDGKCTSLAPTVNTSPEDAAAKVMPYAKPADAPAILPQIAPYVDISPYAEPRPAVGPASVTGPVETTTTQPATGPAQTTTQTPVYNITYSGDTYTYTTVNNTVNPDGSTKTETKPVDDTKSPCEQNPNTVGCAELGTPPAADSIPNAPVSITYSPTLFSGAAGCPAAVPLNFTIAGMSKSFNISYDPLCDIMSRLAPIFLALGAASAALIFMDGLKS